jgi:hypothetical protein
LKRHHADENNVVFDEELHATESPPMDAGAAIDLAQERETVC